MTDDSKWRELMDKVRRPMGLCPPTPEEANRDIANAGEIAMSDEEIRDLVRRATSGAVTEDSDSGHAWIESVDTHDLALDTVVMNRHAGAPDAEVDRRVEAHRTEALGEPKPPLTKLEWRAHEVRLEKARIAAQEILDVMNLSGLVDPLEIAAAESPLLTCRGDDFRDRFDGQLEYHRASRRFLLLYNTKYDIDVVPIAHHPRTRFSIAHELGHYFLEHHRAYFMSGGESHASRGEFEVDVGMEREADTFASALLLPSKPVRSIINEGELSFDVVASIAAQFHTSMVATAMRAVELSDFPCAVVGLRRGAVAWSRCSRSLIGAGLYPARAGSTGSGGARNEWTAFEAGKAARSEGSAISQEWFRTFGRDDLAKLHVTEHYLPVSSMGTLVVLLSVPEDEVMRDDEVPDSEE